MWILVLEGSVIGLLLGMTGAGGGILAVPALMLSQGWTVSQAAPVGLLAVTLAAMLGASEGLIKKWCVTKQRSGSPYLVFHLRGMGFILLD